MENAVGLIVFKASLDGLRLELFPIPEIWDTRGCESGQMMRECVTMTTRMSRRQAQYIFFFIEVEKRPLLLFVLVDMFIFGKRT